MAKGEAFDRDTNYIEDRILADPDSQWPVEPGRYRRTAARACPWANRTIIVRRLLGIERLQQAFFARFPDYPRGITVPAMVEIASGAVVTNDFPRIAEDFSTQWKQHRRERASDLWPEESREETEKVMRLIYTEINNGVYHCSFAGSQEAYDAAFDRLFTALDTIEERLCHSRYLMDGSITEADVRLFATLVRFDPVYFGHFKCNRQTLRDFENLWGYARDLYQTPGFGDTVDFTQSTQHYYIVHVDVNPTQIVPKGPDLAGWLSPHGREKLGGSPFGEGTAPAPSAPARKFQKNTPLQPGCDGAGCVVM